MQNFQPAKVEQSFFPLGGGLDLMTPPIALASGKVFDAQNYEPEVSGGYSRIDGYERYDGRTKPSSAGYWLLSANITGTVAVGNTITGLTSSATGKVLAIVGTTLVLGRVTGAFVSAEALQVSAVTQATSTSASTASGESDPSDDADYVLLAANDYRNDILVVTGSGPIRGVAIYKDVVYAFRDNAGGTAGNMWKATSGGWTQITFQSEFTFTTGAIAPTVGQVIKGATSGATGVVIAVLLRTGAWSGSGVGSIVYQAVTGTFSSGELIKDNALAVTYLTTSSVGAAITRLPGGRVEYVNDNFSGSTDTQKMYGCDGVNKAFEFDGTNYVPIRTGMATDTPSHVIVHRFYLLLSFKGSVQVSALGAPYSWTVVLGGTEIAMGDDVTGFIPQGGNAAGAALGIFTKSRTSILYGSSTANFSLVPSIGGIGYLANTLQPVGTNTYGLTARGIQNLVATQNYGDFDFASISFLIQPLILSKRGLEIASTSLRGKDQYRLFFSDGTGLAMGLTGNEPNGIMPLNYGRVVRCMTTQTLSNGIETTIFGSDDGYVYMDNLGTSFDGEPIEAWIRPAFNHAKSPQVRKRYRRAVFDIKPYGYSKVDISYDLGYANPSVSPPLAVTNNAFFGGGFWDQFTWDQFTWDAKTIADISMSLTGTEKNISFLFYSNRAQDTKHTVHGLTISYTPQRLER